jgi:hypothetical protein
LLEAVREKRSALSLTEMMLRDEFVPDLTPPDCSPELLADPDYPWELFCVEAEELGGLEEPVGFFLSLSPAL